VEEGVRRGVGEALTGERDKQRYVAAEDSKIYERLGHAEFATHEHRARSQAEHRQIPVCDRRVHREEHERGQ
jgi:hypothetical protein